LSNLVYVVVLQLMVPWITCSHTR